MHLHLSCLEHSWITRAVLLIRQASSLHGLFVELNSITVFYFLQTACQCWQFSYLHICLHVSVFLMTWDTCLTCFRLCGVVTDDAWYTVSTQGRSLLFIPTGLLSLFPLQSDFLLYKAPPTKKRAQRWSPVPTVSPATSVHFPQIQVNALP